MLVSFGSCKNSNDFLTLKFNQPSSCVRFQEPRSWVEETMLPPCSSLFIIEPCLWMKASISEGTLDYRWFNFLAHCDHSLKNVAPHCWILATTSKKKILQGDTYIPRLSDLVPLRKSVMTVFFCTIPNTATAAANAESAKTNPTLLHRNRFDCATAVISKPWNALENPITW